MKKINLRFDDVEGTIVIENPLQKKIQIDRGLTSLLGLTKFGLIEKGRKLKIKTIINQLTFDTYLIHCDLIDWEENLFYQNKRSKASPSSILASFDITGGPFERVTYSPEGEAAIRKIKNLNHITSIRIKVTDENGDLIDFNGLPLRFEIEIV